MRCAAQLLKPLLGFGLCLAAAVSVQAGYQSTILADSPVGYWRLDEANVCQPATNSGSAGPALSASYNLGKFVPVGGAITGDADAGIQFDGGAGRIEIPYTPALNPNGPFSVEFWAVRTSSAASTYYCPLWSRGGGVSGYLFYTDANNKWAFWIGATNGGTGTTWVAPVSKATVTNNVWYHLVGTYGYVVTTNNLTNWYASLYVNGVLQTNLPVPTNYSYVVNSTIAPASPFRIGAGTYTWAGGYFWPGRMDEVTFYTNTLTAQQVANHWSTGTNAARTLSYAATIKSDAPLGYWRLDETNTALAFNQAGASLGATGNGSYAASPNIPSSVDPSGIQINPLGWPGSISPQATGALTGSGDNDPAVDLTLTSSGAPGGRVEVPYNSALNAKSFSAECWVNLRSYPTWTCPMGNRWSATGVYGGYEVLIYTGGQMQFWLGVGQSNPMKLVANNIVPLSTWNHLVAVYDGTYMYLYMNAELVGATPAYLPHTPNTSNPLRIGGGGADSLLGNFYLDGSLDEVAYYGYPLSEGQVASHYAAGLGTPPVATTVPSFTVQPQGATVETGGSASLTGIALGALPMRYQWYRDGTLLPGQTNCTLNLVNLSTAASGTYEIVANNAAGNSSASAFVQVNPATSPYLVTDLPTTTPYYAGANPQLTVVTSGSLPQSFFWRSNGVLVAVTSLPTLTLTNLQASASGATISLTVSNALGTAASTGTTLQMLTPVTGDYVSRVLALNPLAYWRLGESSTTPYAIDSWGGNNAQYINVNQHTTPGALSVNDDGCAELTGAGSTILVPNGAPFAFGPTNQFTLMAWIKPTTLTGIQRVFSDRQTGPYIAGYGFGIRGATNLIFTAFGVADISANATVPANQWSHLAAVYSNKTVTLYFNGAVVGTARSALNSLLPSVMPLYIGGSTNSSEPFNGLVDEAVIYGTALTSTQIITIFGSKPSITIPPSPATAYTGAAARFSILGSGLTPLVYQWRTNGVNVLSQTNTTLVLPRVQPGLSGCQVTCVITNSLGAITSSPVALTVISVGGYLGSVLADRPVAFWRLDETAGPTIRDFVDSHDGTAAGGILFSDSTLTSPLATGGDTDPCMGFNGTNGAVVVPYYPELNQPIYSVECWVYDTGPDTGYRAPVTSRDNTNSSGAGYILYCGMTGIICGNKWQYWTGPATNYWDYMCGTAVDHYNWVHLVATYDGTNKSLYVNGALAASYPLTVLPNQRRVMAIGASGTEAYPSTLSGYWAGDLDEVAYYGYALGPEQIMGHYLLASFGTNQAPQVTSDLESQTVIAGETCTLSAGVTGSTPMGYQWYKDNAALATGKGLSYNATNWFSLVLPNVQPSNAGKYRLTVTNNVGSVTTSEITLAVLARPAFSSARYLGTGGFELSFSGPAGQNYRIWTSSDVTLTPVESTWTLVSSGSFTGAAQTFTDTSAHAGPSEFYIMTVP